MPKVRTYPEKKMEELGAERWRVTWETERPGCDAGADDGDFDRDLIYHSKTFATHKAATRKAGAAARESFFGCATIRKEVVGFEYDADLIAQWLEVGEVEDVS